MRRGLLLIFGFCGSVCALILLCISGAATSRFASYETIRFPYNIPRSPLVIVDSICYDGPYLEDHSGRETISVAAVLVKNTSGEMIKWARVSLVHGQGSQVYELTMLPPGGTVLVLEKCAADYKQIGYSDIFCEFKFLHRGADRLTALITQTDQITVRNTYSNEIAKVSIYYKTIDPETKLYIGGVTHCAEVSNLAPGEYKVVSAPYVVSGYTDVVYITAEK